MINFSLTYSWIIRLNVTSPKKDHQSGAKLISLFVYKVLSKWKQSIWKTSPLVCELHINYVLPCTWNSKEKLENITCSVFKKTYGICFHQSSNYFYSRTVLFFLLIVKTRLQGTLVFRFIREKAPPKKQAFWLEKVCNTLVLYWRANFIEIILYDSANVCQGNKWGMKRQLMSLGNASHSWDSSSGPKVLGTESNTYTLC